jgi:hypothetical protein
LRRRRITELEFSENLVGGEHEITENCQLKQTHFPIFTIFASF